MCDIDEQSLGDAFPRCPTQNNTLTVDPRYCKLQKLSKAYKRTARAAPILQTARPPYDVLVLHPCYSHYPYFFSLTSFPSKFFFSISSIFLFFFGISNRTFRLRLTLSSRGHRDRPPPYPSPSSTNSTCLRTRPPIHSRSRRQHSFRQ